ncbi:MAG TPA: hypothetical protein VM597_20075 [Gemmataceae bacterium]|jgi:hypothetical protein|nr:hypothetical protein [Gemmataceae bacterium]
MSILDPIHQPSPAADARCSPDERAEVNRHEGELVDVNGKPAVIAPTVPISGDPSDRIRVTFPPDASRFPEAPPEIQKIIDRLTFSSIT